MVEHRHHGDLLPYHRNLSFCHHCLQEHLDGEVFLSLRRRLRLEKKHLAVGAFAEDLVRRPVALAEGRRGVRHLLGHPSWRCDLRLLPALYDR